MSQNRIIYQSEAVYVSKNEISTSENDHKQLKRIQNVDYSFNIPREYINQYGQLGAIDAIVIASPTVSLNFSYYLTNLDNEANLGFYIKRRSAIYTGSNGLITTEENGNLSGYCTNQESNFITNKLTQESGANYFIATSREGVDLNLENSISEKTIVGIGNTLINKYSIQAQVGQFPTVNIEAEGLNINSSFYKSYPINEFSQDVGFPIPSVNTQNGKPLYLKEDGYYNLVKLNNPSPSTGEYEINALRPSDINLNFNNLSPESSVSNLNSDLHDVNLQSFSLSIDFNRQINQQMGYKFVNSRPIGYPIVATLNINALVNESQIFNLIKNIDNSEGKSILISINSSKKPQQKALTFDLRNFLLTSESFISSVNDNKLVDLTFEGHFGSSLDFKNGIFASGSISDAFSEQTNNVYFNYEINNDWYDQDAWFSNSSFSTPYGSLPQSYSDVIMYGSNGAYIDLDNANWIQPNSIDTRNVSDPYGICFYSNNSAQFSGIVYGNSSFFGNASPV